MRRSRRLRRYTFMENPVERCSRSNKGRENAKSDQSFSFCKTSRVPGGPMLARRPQHFFFQNAFSEPETRQEGYGHGRWTVPNLEAAETSPKVFFKR